MNKKAQTEDVFADMIPSIILIVIGIFVLYYFSSGFSDELEQNKVLFKEMSDRESFTIEGMMNHKVLDLKWKEYRIIDVLEMYSKTDSKIDRFNYETMIRGGANDYVEKIEPKITSCMRIMLSIPPESEMYLVRMCELNKEKEIKKEQALIPLSDGRYAKIRLEYGEPEQV